MALLNLNATLRSNMVNQITSRAGASALLRIYKGTKPATGGSPGAGDLLAALTMNATFAPASPGTGVITCNAIQSALAGATGLASWWRIVQSDGATHVMDGDVSTVAAGSGSMLLDVADIVLGGTVAISSAIFSQGNA